MKGDHFVMKLVREGLSEKALFKSSETKKETTWIP